MVSTSGDISVTQFDVVTLIEMAARRAGRLSGSLSQEELIYAQDELSMMINALVNEGVPLWTVNKQIYGLNLNQNLLPLSPDTVDVQNVLYRYNNLPSGGTPIASSGNAANAFDQNLNTACTQTAINGYIEYNFGTPVVIVTAGMLMHSTQTLNPIYEYSLDGVTWVTSVSAASAPSTYTVGQWYWVDVASPQSAQYYRVRETSGGTLDATEIVFSTPAREILLPRTNKDDYQNLPNKNFPGRSLQYWFDRQIIPQMWLWPASAYSFNSVVVWARRIIQNVGSFTNSLQFPNRWLDTIIFSLAERLLYIIPGLDLNRAPLLMQKAAQARELAWREERDASPLYYAPNISYYTRGSGMGYH